MFKNFKSKEILFEFIVDKKNHGKRIDSFLYQKLHELKKHISRNFIQSHFHYIKINGYSISKKNIKVHYKDLIQYLFKQPSFDYINPFSEIDLSNYPKINILYEDSFLFIIYKPKNLLSHPSYSSKYPSVLHIMKDKLTSFKEDYLFSFKAFQNLEKNINLKENLNILRPGIVHRLDKDCSGILILAKNHSVQEKLIILFKERKIKKQYIALVKGEVPKISRWINPIGRDSKNRKKFSIGKNIIHPKNAETQFKRIQLFQKNNSFFSFVKINLITGRQHQIRVHFSKNGYPIIGDPLYSKISSDYEKQGLALFAYSIKFKHPITQKYIHIKLPIPKFFKKIIKLILNT